MFPTAHARLNDAYTACRQAGIPTDTLTAFARAVISSASGMPWAFNSGVMVFDSPMRFTSFHDENDARIFRSDHGLGSYRMTEGMSRSIRGLIGHRNGGF